MQTTIKNNRYNYKSRSSPLLVAAVRRLIPVLLLFAMLPSPARASGSGVSEPVPPWLEPRGLGVVDLVGLVPESLLQGAIVRFVPGLGLVLYESGTRQGGRVTIRVRYVNQYPGVVWCLGKPGERDEWSVAVPPSTARFYHNGVDITRSLAATFDYTPAGFTLPNRNTGHLRYPLLTASTQFNAAGEAMFPANTGCQFTVTGADTGISAEFTFFAPQVVQVQTLGSVSGRFQSYIGPGSSGQLRSLQEQMGDRYGDRHGGLRVSVPAGTNYVLVRHPLTPVDAYGRDMTLPAGGTYRIRRSNGRLSVDHLNTMAIPFYGQWQDADQSGGSSFLPYFTDSVEVTAPEYFVPEGVAYQPCMTYGGCSDALLDTIYRAEMTMTVNFLKVTPITGEMVAVPLRAVGPDWSAGQTAAQTTAAGGRRVWLPLVSRQISPPPFDPNSCPCGWFMSDGRMIGFIPAPD